jgi:hypothetical protein
MGNLANGGDFNAIMAFEGDSGTEYVSSGLGEWTAWTHKPNGDSSAPCKIGEAYDCVWQFLQSEFKENPFFEENAWTTYASGDRQQMKLTGKREFNSLTQVSPQGWKIGEER